MPVPGCWMRTTRPRRRHRSRVYLARAMATLTIVALLVLSGPSMGGPSRPIGEAGADPTPVSAEGWSPSSGFLQNGGQVSDPAIRFYSWSPGGGIALLDTGVLLTVVGEGLPGCNVRLSFEGATPVEPVGRSPLHGTTSFIRGADPAGWATGLSTYGEVWYEGIYEDIDLVYRLEGGVPKYDLVIGPGADPADIAFSLSGHDGLSLTRDGDLAIATPAGTLLDSGLVAFYADDPSEEVECGFDLRGPDEYGFRLGPRDAGRAVVIDPLVYSTFVGGAVGEWELASGGVAVDGSGRAVVAGFSNTTDFPTTPGAFQVDNAGGGGDVCVFRLSASGDDLDWSTYIGGGGSESPYDMALDPSGRPIVVGWTNSTDFPTTDGSLRPSRSGTDQEGFVLKLSPDGSDLAWSTYLGGNDTDEVVAVALDDLGSVYVAGNTISGDLPTSPWAHQQNHSGGLYDAFVAKLAPDGSDLAYMTYLGGDRWDIAGGLGVDGSGFAYVGGQTLSGNLSTQGAFCETVAGFLDAFVAKVNATGSGLGFLTYIGGSREEMAEFVDVAPNGTVTVAGVTESPLFPTTDGAFQTLHRGMQDAFVLRLSANGSVLEYSTLFGGSNRDTCEGFAMDGTGSTYLTGRTYSNNVTTLRGAHQFAFGGVIDAYVARLDLSGSELLYSSYLGGSRVDIGQGIALDPDGNATIVGGTESTDFPTTPGAYQEAIGGRVDVFVTKMDPFLDLEPPVAVPGEDMIIDMYETVHFDGSASTDNVGIVNWTWNFTYDGSPMSLYGPEVEWTFDIAGKYYVYLHVHDAVGNVGSQWVSVYVRDTEFPVAVAPGDIYGQQHWNIVLDGMGSTDNVGIDGYNWTFFYEGANVTLEGGRVEFTFHEAGTYVVTLNVTDPEGNWDTASFTIHIQDITVPVAVAGQDVTVDQHTRVVFNSTGSEDNVGITNHTWRFVYRGVPIHLFGPSPAFTFDAAGTYDVTLSVVDAVDNQATDQMRVTVRDTTPPVAVAGYDTIIDQGQLLSLDGTGSSDNVRVSGWGWTIVLGDEVTNFSGSRTSFTFSAAGVYSVTLNVTDDAGNWATDSFRVTVRDVTDPVADAGEDIEASQGSLVTFDGTGSHDNVGILSYTWTFEEDGSTVTLSGPSPNHTYDRFGKYMVTLTVVDTSGRTATDEVEVTVVDTEPPVAVANPPQRIKVGERAHFSAAGSSDNSGIWSYSWTFHYNQALVELEDEEASQVFQLRGNYTVTLTVTDLSFNTATAVTYVEVVGEDDVIDGDGDGDGDVGRALYYYVLMFAVIALVGLVLVALLMRRPRGDAGWVPTEEELADRRAGDEGEGGASEEGEKGAAQEGKKGTAQEGDEGGG